MTIALASGNGYSWQCEWTPSHKYRSLRVKIATHGIANKLNRMMSMIAWVPSQWRLRRHFTCDCEQGRYCHYSGVGYTIEACQHGLWDCVVRVPPVTKLAREVRLKVFEQNKHWRCCEDHWSRYRCDICDWKLTFFNKIKEIFRARLVTSQYLVEITFNRIFRAIIVTAMALPNIHGFGQKKMQIAFFCANIVTGGTRNISKIWTTSKAFQSHFSRH